MAEGRRKFSSNPFAPSTLERGGWNHHAQSTFPSGMTRYPLCKKLCGPQGRSGLQGKSPTYWDSIGCMCNHEKSQRSLSIRVPILVPVISQNTEKVCHPLDREFWCRLMGEYSWNVLYCFSSKPFCFVSKIFKPNSQKLNINFRSPPSAVNSSQEAISSPAHQLQMKCDNFYRHSKPLSSFDSWEMPWHTAIVLSFV